uniref:Vitamin K-dependent protein C n=1 Tax=Denticeps clupeoides TaxID=299321 RepID=A0AAY4A9C2_9TELE
MPGTRGAVCGDGALLSGTSVAPWQIGIRTGNLLITGPAYCGILCLFVSTVCGRPTVTNRVHRRIIGGQWAAPGSIPWQVFLTVPYGRGGAAVIGSRWILTAAHILNDVLPEHVRVGSEFSIIVSVECEKIEVIVKHKRNYNHDIALIKLKQHITFNTNIMPLCLPSRDHQYIPDTLVSGFGMTEDKKIPTKLRFVRVPLVKDDVCRKSIEKITNETSEDFKFTENMFCAGFPEGGRDSCSGDGGGAFALENNNQFWAAGIVSWGVNCGEAGKYGVYTRVAQYSGWINDIMEGKCKFLQIGLLHTPTFTIIP